MEEDFEFKPPSEERVRRRAWVMSSVICRSFLETYDVSEAENLRSNIVNWIDDMELYPEFEPWEIQTIEAEIGTLERQTVVNGTWRSEGLVVLAWSLNATTLPPHDYMVDPSEVANSVFFLAEDAKDRSRELTLRSEEELERFADIQLALHWRIRDFSLRPRSMDFREFAETAWFGPLNIDGISLAEDDLAIDGVPISKAPSDRVYQCQSIVMERHQAINWLRGDQATYSEVDTST